MGPSTEQEAPGRLDTPVPYHSPHDLKKPLTAAECDTTLDDELEAKSILDPLARYLGPQTPPQFTDVEVDIPQINLPLTDRSGDAWHRAMPSPMTNVEDQLLDLMPGSLWKWASRQLLALAHSHERQAQQSTRQEAPLCHRDSPQL